MYFGIVVLDTTYLPSHPYYDCVFKPCMEHVGCLFVLLYIFECIGVCMVLFAILHECMVHLWCLYLKFDKRIKIHKPDRSDKPIYFVIECVCVKLRGDKSCLRVCEC